MWVAHVCGERNVLPVISNHCNSSIPFYTLPPSAYTHTHTHMHTHTHTHAHTHTHMHAHAHTHTCTHTQLPRSGDPSSASDDFQVSLTHTMCSLLPLLPITTSAASMHWFLRLVTSTSRSHAGHMTSRLYLTLLVELTKQLNTKGSLNAQLLQTQ